MPSAWELKIVEFLQRGSNVFLDALMRGITLFGDEIFFMIVAVLVYWCINKRLAFKFANVYFLSVAVNEALKIIIKRPRPYTYDSVRSIGEKTSGYSMPSGHSQSIANIGTQFTLKTIKANKLIIILPIVLTALVMFSRIYLGQHYLTDTLVGAALGIVLAVIFSYLFELLGNSEERLMFVIVPLCLIVLIFLLASGGINASPNVQKVLGAYGAFTLGYYLEKRFVKYEPNKSSRRKTILKVLLGLAVTLLLKEGLKFLIPENLGVLYAFMRYFLVAAWVSIGSMAVFKALKL